MDFFKSHFRILSTALPSDQVGQSFTAEEYGVVKTGVQPIAANASVNGHTGSLIYSMHPWGYAPVIRGCRISFYKGSMPTPAEIDLLSASDFVNYRNSDKLLSCSSSAATYGLTAGLNLGLYQASFPVSEPLSEGTISWFTVLFREDYGNAEGDPRILFGTVGDIGSGADIEMDERIIEHGNMYTIPTFFMRGMPLGFEFE